MRANWAEISRAALRFNWMAFRRRRPRPAAGAPPLRLCAVVKANAYGHGLLECAQVFVAAGAEWLAVTDTAEALALRQGGIAARILVLGDFDREDAQEIVRHRLTPTVWTRAQADRLARAGARHRRPPGLPLAVHLKLDTGMARIGAAPAEFAALARHAAACGLAVEAAYTHLASAEGPAAGVAAQMRRLRAALAALDRRLLAPGFFWHAANSAAAWRWPAAGRPGLPGAVRQLDAAGMVRVGLGLYGSCLVPGAEAALRPVLAWKTRIIALREVSAGAPVGYGGDRPGGWKAPRRSRIATLACGYADGYLRAVAFAPQAHVLVRGRPAPFAGRISMDLMSVEVTAIPGARLGDEVVLIGAQRGARIRPRDLARWAGTIPYEITCALALRVPRRYH